MTSGWQTATLVTLAASALATAAAAIALARRAALARVGRDEMARRVDELSRRLAGSSRDGDARRTPAVPADALPRHRADRPAPPARHRSGPSPGPTLIAVPSLTAEGSGEAAAEAAAGLARRFGALWSLADEGAAPAAIARATGFPVGQVELILGLRGRARPDGAGEGEADGHD